MVDAVLLLYLSEKRWVQLRLETNAAKSYHSLVEQALWISLEISVNTIDKVNRSAVDIVKY